MGSADLSVHVMWHYCECWGSVSEEPRCENDDADSGVDGSGVGHDGFGVDVYDLHSKDDSVRTAESLFKACNVHCGGTAELYQLGDNRAG